MPCELRRWIRGSGRAGRIRLAPELCFVFAPPIIQGDKGARHVPFIRHTDDSQGAVRADRHSFRIPDIGEVAKTTS